MDLYQIIGHPLVTEKSTRLQEQNKYVFAVDKKSSKNEIKKAVKKLFNVDTIDIRTFNVKGKKLRVPKQNKFVKRKDWKKVIVTVKKGQNIDVFKSVKTDEKKKG